MNKKFIMNTYSRFDVTFDYGKGCFLYDTNGKKYIDFASGIAVNSLGYGCKKIEDTILNQSKKLLHCSNLYWSEPQMELAQKLCNNSSFDKAFFCNSGAEANEAALKLAKIYAKKNKGDNCTKFIAFKNSFHGRTIGALSLTGQDKYQKNFTPLMSEVKFAAYNDINSLKECLDKNVCAIFLEPIQGEGGIIPAKEEFLKEVRKICTENNIALIFDEVQCGMGRCGKLFAHQVYNINPDILTLAKAIGGGIPMGAMLANDKFASSFGIGDHASTFGGNLLACACANVVVDEILNTNLLENVAQMSAYFFEKLNKLKEKYSFIKDVRGLGLMLGIELDTSVKEIVNKAFSEGLLILSAGSNVVRFVPPLIIDKKVADEGFSILEKVFKNIKGE